jgi:CRP/FNR family transcriptional regulator, dissimilatory nitrate respiration regulator
MLDNNYEALSSLPFFSQLSKDVRIQLINMCTLQPVAKDETLFLEGQTAKGAFIVLTGRIMVYKIAPDGREQIIHIWERGGLFAEVSLWGGTPYPAHARALDDGLVVLLPRQPLLNLVRKTPDIAFALLAAMSKRQRHLVTLVESLSLKEVPARLAVYLLQLAEDSAAETVVLELKKNRLAALLGTIPETLSRVLARLEKAGIVRREGQSKVHILDSDLLQAIADQSTRLK